MTDQPRVLLTGATGFIGREVATTLVGGGMVVRAPIFGGEAPAGVEVVPGVDLTAPSLPAGLVRGVDVVIHCAARAHVTRETASDPLSAFRAANRDATLRLAEAAAANGVKRFLFLSSIGVLGERTGEVPFGASSSPAPAVPYAVSKLEAEQGLLELGARTGMEIVIIRPPLVHGPGAPGNFRRLLRLVATGFPLPFAGIDGRRSFVGRSNLCSLIKVAMTHPAAPRSPLLPADAETLTLPELLNEIAAGLGKGSRLFRLPFLGAVAHVPKFGAALRKLTDSLVVDGSETRSRLGWTPPVTAHAGIRAMARAWQEAR
jgi:nucleoside-diphosphate-sugar epimerase